jgi:hypothetical protein
MGRRLAPSVVTGNKRLTRLFPGEQSAVFFYEIVLAA